MNRARSENHPNSLSRAFLTNSINLRKASRLSLGRVVHDRVPFSCLMKIVSMGTWIEAPIVVRYEGVDLVYGLRMDYDGLLVPLEWASVTMKEGLPSYRENVLNTPNADSKLRRFEFHERLK